jgi:hypothetical protein
VPVGLAEIHQPPTRPSVAGIKPLPGCMSKSSIIPSLPVATLVVAQEPPATGLEPAEPVGAPAPPGAAPPKPFEAPPKPFEAPPKPLLVPPATLVEPETPLEGAPLKPVAPAPLDVAPPVSPPLGGADSD